MKKISESQYSKCMYFVSNALAREMEKMAIESWKKVDLSPSHGYLLLLVLNQPGIQPLAISEELHLQPSTITRLIEKLEEKKLVARIYEGRLANIYPTPKAKELAPKLQECVVDFSETYTATLGNEDSAKLIRQMHRVSDKLVH